MAEVTITNMKNAFSSRGNPDLGVQDIILINQWSCFKEDPMIITNYNKIITC